VWVEPVATSKLLGIPYIKGNSVQKACYITEGLLCLRYARENMCTSIVRFIDLHTVHYIYSNKIYHLPFVTLMISVELLVCS
jgi:hypothetical protein